MLDRKFFRGISTELVERYRKHIFEDAKDVYGKNAAEIIANMNQSKQAALSNIYGTVQNWQTQAGQIANTANI